jgi:hypothetical protein
MQTKTLISLKGRVYVIPTSIFALPVILTQPVLLMRPVVLQRIFHLAKDCEVRNPDPLLLLSVPNPAGKVTTAHPNPSRRNHPYNMVTGIL